MGCIGLSLFHPQKSVYINSYLHTPGNSKQLSYDSDLFHQKILLNTLCSLGEGFKRFIIS